jgi:Acetyltransferase (GNAT) family
MIRATYERVSSKLLSQYVDLNAVEYADNPICHRDHLEWKYLRNPQGIPWATHLYDGDDLVGRIVFQPRNVWCGERRIKAANPIDLLIHPSYRGMGAFMRLMRVDAWRDHFEVLFLTPNNNSMLLYEKALRFPAPIRLEAVAYPVRFSPLFERIFVWRVGSLAMPFDFCLRHPPVLSRADIEFHTDWPSDETLNGLFSVLRQQEGWIGERDSAFLNWRLRQSPRLCYQTTFLYLGANLCGFYATSVQSYLNLRVLFVMDLAGTADVSARAWRAARMQMVLEAISRDCDLVFGLFNLRSRRLQRVFGFPWVRVPTRFLPQPVPVFVSEFNQALVQWAEFALTPMDLDVF